MSGDDAVVVSLDGSEPLGAAVERLRASGFEVQLQLDAIATVIGLWPGDLADLLQIAGVQSAEPVRDDYGLDAGPDAGLEGEPR